MSRRSTRDDEFADFVVATSPRLYRTALLMTASHHGAEDLVQSTWVKAYAAWPRVQSARDPVAYLHGILIKTFRSAVRRRSSGEIPMAQTPDRRIAPVEPAERLALLAALRELAPLDRAVVVLRYWEDHSVQQTAADLRLSPAAVKNRSLRALRSLRELLSDQLTPAEARSTQ